MKISQAAIIGILAFYFLGSSCARSFPGTDLATWSVLNSNGSGSANSGLAMTGPGVVLGGSTSAFVSESGTTSTFTAVLNTQPTATVSFSATSSDTTEGLVSLDNVTYAASVTLSFDSTNWNIPQTVYVKGQDDVVVDGDIIYNIILGSVTSSDPDYSGYNPPDVSAVTFDNDGGAAGIYGIAVSPSSGLTTSEGGGTAKFAMVLTAQPSANVTIGLSSSNLAEGTVSPASLTFTSVNWNSPQVVTATGVDDLTADGNVPYSIVTAAAASADTNYNGLDPSDVSITNMDNDTAGISIGTTTLFVSEGSTNAVTFQVVLNSQPAVNVDIPFTCSDTTEAVLSKDNVTYGASTTLTFTTANWATPQTIYVKSVDDVIIDGNIASTIASGPAIAVGDPVYNGMNPADVSVTTYDNDTGGVPGIQVYPTSGLFTTEAGGTAEFGMILQSMPTANVTIPISSSTPTEGTPSVASLTFTTGNWNTPQIVTITGVNDGVLDGNIAYTIVTGAATSTDAAYNGLNPPDVSVTNIGNTPGAMVTPTSGLSTSESGTSASFVIYLTSRPTANVTIPLNSTNTLEGTVAPASVTFTPANWSVPQIVTATGVDDFVTDGDQTYQIITGTTVSTDVDYNGTINPDDVTFVNVDNDIFKISVNASDSIVTSESGLSQSFTVVLSSRPSGTNTVTIPVSVSDATEATILSPFVGTSGNLIFTTGNWSTPQTVTVAGVDDGVIDGPIAYTVIIGVSSSGDAKYNGINPADIPATNLDNDGAAGITVIPTSLSTFEGDQDRQFYVVLNTTPTANVVLPVTNSNSGQVAITAPFTGVSGNLTFTPGNWNIPQAVTIRAFENGVIDAPGPVALTITLGADTTTADTTGYLNLNPADVSVSVSHSDKHAYILRDATGTAVGSKGNIGSVAAADALCMAATNYPGSGTYKAVIVDNTPTRRACTTANCQTGGAAEHLDWVLQPWTMYFVQQMTAAGPVYGWFPSFRTDAIGIYNFQSGKALLNPFHETTGYVVWMGLQANWTTSANTCTNWTNGAPGGTGDGGGTFKTDYQSIYWPPVNACNLVATLLCVEQ